MPDHNSIGGSKKAGTRSAIGQRNRDRCIQQINRNWNTDDFFTLFPPGIEPISLGDTAVQILKAVSSKVDSEQAMRRLKKVCQDINGRPIKVSFKYISMVNERLKEKESILEGKKVERVSRASRASTGTSQPESEMQPGPSRNRAASMTYSRDYEVVSDDEEQPSVNSPLQSPLQDRSATPSSISRRSSLFSTSPKPHNSTLVPGPITPINDAYRSMSYTGPTTPSGLNNENTKASDLSANRHDESESSSIVSINFSTPDRVNERKRSLDLNQGLGSPTKKKPKLSGVVTNLVHRGAKETANVKSTPNNSVSQLRESPAKPSTDTEPKLGQNSTMKKAATMDSETRTPRNTYSEGSSPMPYVSPYLPRTNTNPKHSSQSATAPTDSITNGQGKIMDATTTSSSQSPKTSSSPASLDIESQLSLFGDVIEAPKHDWRTPLKNNDQTEKLLALRRRNNASLEKIMSFGTKNAKETTSEDCIVVDHPLDKGHSEGSSNSTPADQQVNDPTTPKQYVRSRKRADPFLQPKRNKPYQKSSNAIRTSRVIQPIRNELVPQTDLTGLFPPSTPKTSATRTSTPTLNSAKQPDHQIYSRASTQTTPSKQGVSENGSKLTQGLASSSLSTSLDQSQQILASHSKSLDQVAYSTLRTINSVLATDEIVKLATQDNLDQALMLQKLFDDTRSRFSNKVDAIFTLEKSKTSDQAEANNLVDSESN